MPRPKRQSIQPTYDHRETGDRYWVTTEINGKPMEWRKPLTDPFVRHTIHLHWRDLLRGLLRRSLSVTVAVGGDHDIQEDVMELDGNYLEWGSTRRDEWNAGMHKRLARFGKEREAAESGDFPPL
jgi:hypothetical protein